MGQILSYLESYASDISEIFWKGFYLLVHIGYHGDYYIQPS